METGGQLGYPVSPNSISTVLSLPRHPRPRLHFYAGARPCFRPQVLWRKLTGQTASSVGAGVQFQNQPLCQEMESGGGRRNSEPGQKDRKMRFVWLFRYFF